MSSHLESEKAVYGQDGTGAVSAGERRKAALAEIGVFPIFYQTQLKENHRRSELFLVPRQGVHRRR